MDPGPVNVPAAVRDATLGPDLCHREAEYAEPMQAVRRGLVRAAVLVAGSGTAAVEMVVRSLVRDGRKLLVVRNGVYGDRMARMAEVHGIERVEIEAGWTERPDPARVEEALSRDPTTDAGALVHHETTTGLLNPVRAIGEACRRHGALLVLDPVSGFGGEELDLDGWGVGAVASTANRCLHGKPGASFVPLSGAARERLGEVRPRTVHLDLGAYLDAQERGSVTFTPCVPAVQGLAAAIGLLEAEGGVPARVALYRRRAALVREGLEGAGLSMLLAAELRSTSISALHPPEGVSFASLHERLKASGFVVYAGQGPLAERALRVANTGDVPMEVYRRFVACVADALG